LPATKNPSRSEAVPTEENKGTAKVQSLEQRELVIALDDAPDDNQRVQHRSRKTDDCLLIVRLIDGLHKNMPYGQLIENGKARVSRRVDVAMTNRSLFDASRFLPALGSPKKISKWPGPKTTTPRGHTRLQRSLE